MHFQTGITNMQTPIGALPNRSLVKAVQDPSLLQVAYDTWKAKGRDLSKLYLNHRHPDFELNFSTDFNAMKEMWRRNFFRFVDGTYLAKYAPIVTSVEEANEYTDTRMVTDSALRLPRLVSAQAAVWVWNNEFRGKEVHSPDGGVGTIRADCRLVLCNSPVGNDVPRQWYELAVAEDAILGVHPYTHWANKQRDPGDFRYHSGRWNYNEQAYGVKPVYMFTECGPYNGSTDGGWRHSTCLGGDEALLAQAMKLWFQDLMGTSAYAEGRMLGAGAWFTSSNQGDWQYYKLWDTQLSSIVHSLNDLGWNPGTYTPPPPPPDECYGTPRVDYKREVVVIPSYATLSQAKESFEEAWTSARKTVSGSYDDAGIGDLSNKTATLLGIDDKPTFSKWYSDEYPGTKVVYKDMPPRFHWPLQGPHQTTFYDWSRFGAPRDYDGDGVADDIHEGQDFSAVVGQAVLACDDGVVVWASNKRRSNPTEDSSYGWHVVIDHGNGVFTWYGHCSKLWVEAGMLVKRGQIIAYAGNTGISTGPHLHLTVQDFNDPNAKPWVQGHVVDPMPWLGL